MKFEDFEFYGEYQGMVQYFQLKKIFPISIFQECKTIFDNQELNNLEVFISVFPNFLPETAINTLNRFLDNQKDYEEIISKSILQFYMTNIFSEIYDYRVFDKDDCGEYPSFSESDFTKIKDFVRLVELHIPLHKTEGQFGLVFNSPWDEHGIGITFKDYNLNSIGFAEEVHYNFDDWKIYYQEQLLNEIILPTPPPIYMHLKDLNKTIHWVWINGKYIQIHKMKGEFDSDELEYDLLKNR